MPPDFSRQAEIAQIRQAIERLDRERARLLERLTLLEGQPAPVENSELGPDEKVELFGSLFRGRDDVFPRLWSNAKTGKSGYAPACSQEWTRGVCEKPKVKCGECRHQAFLPVTRSVLLDHLQGRHVVGAYALLRDETCWFLAVDFDGSGWQEDVRAFRATCREAGLEPVVERSRSGNGAHAWFFFARPVEARIARNAVCYLLTATIERHDGIGLDSYDRLFPNQDTMPRGGFGNLIALPLQHEARSHGNTLFLDEDLEPYPDPWALLARVPRLEPEQILGLAREGERRGRVVGARLEEDDFETGTPPWDRPPSGRPREEALPPPLPEALRCVLAQRLYIERTGLSPALLSRFRRMAAFQNPQFYSKQKMRLSTAGTPRVISCAEDFPEHLALPRGCLEELEDRLREAGVSLELEDKRCLGEELEVRFSGKLRDFQEKAVEELLRTDTGVFVAPPGSGKTVVGACLIARRRRSTLVLVHRQPLLEQWINMLALFLDLDPKEIGRIGGGKRKPNGRLDVATVQSLTRGGPVADLVAGYGHVVVDECHHIPAFSFEAVLKEARARFVTGFTATVRRRDGHHPITAMQFGGVRHSIDGREAALLRPFNHLLVVRETGYRPGQENLNIAQHYSAMAQSEARDERIVSDVLRSLEEGRFPLVLTQRLAHLDSLARRLAPGVDHLFVLHGGLTPKQRAEALDALKSAPEGACRVILATGSFIGEGFDDARLDTLFLAMPISWKGTIIQYTGRLHRYHPDKGEVRIYDYVDSQVPVLQRMFEKRLAGYRSIGYTEDDRAEQLTLEC